MNRERHRRVLEIFSDCCEKPAAEREAYLDLHCGADADLRSEVEALLDFERRRPDFLKDRPTAALARSAPAAGPPERIGSFRVLGVLGEGGMGTVYEAEQDKPHRRVALKLLRGPASAEVRRRFELESELLGRLHHPGIARVLEAGSADLGGGWQPYFAMELVRGRPLTEYAREKRLDLRRCLELLAEVCDAVEHAHRRGVIHRDLKPGNVLVTEEGRPVVLDFGVARVTDSDLRVTTLHTGAGQVIGTLPYMSPEQACGDASTLDARADVYALGVIAYELLTGRLPHDFEGVSIQEALRAIREDEPRAPSQIERAVRGDLQTILLKALEKAPERRYDSAAALGADLRRWLHDEPIQARPASATYKLRKFAARNRPFVAAALVVFASTLGAAVVSARAALRAAHERDLAVLAQARAERRFADLHALSEKLLFDLHDEVATLAGSTAARELLVGTALEYLSKLSAEAEDDPALLADLAEAYARVGDIQGHPRRANLGRTQDALASYTKSLALRERLLALDGGAGEHTRQKALLLQRMGAVCNATGSHAEALTSYTGSAALLEPLVDVDDVARGDLGAALDLIGSTYEQMGRPEEALAAYLRSHEQSEALVAGRPEDQNLVRDLTVTCNEVALMLERLGRLDEAEPYVLRALALREELTARNPDDARARRDLALSRHRAGSLALQRGDPAAALTHFELALTTLRSLVEADPRDNRARFDLSVAHGKCASALRDLGQLERELEHRSAVLELREELVRENPDNSFHAGARASALEQLAAAHARAGRPRAAEDAWRRAISRADEVVARYPDDAYSWTVVHVACYDLGRQLLEEQLGAGTRDLGRLVEARALLGRSLETLDAMTARGVDPTQVGPERPSIVAAIAESGRALER